MIENERDQQPELVNEDAGQTAVSEASMPGPLLIDGMPDFTEAFTFKANGRTWGLCWDCNQKVQYSGDQFVRHISKRSDHVKRQLLPLGEKPVRDIYENLDEHVADSSVPLVKKQGINVRNAGRRAIAKVVKEPETE